MVAECGGVLLLRTTHHASSTSTAAGAAEHEYEHEGDTSNGLVQMGFVLNEGVLVIGRYRFLHRPVNIYLFPDELPSSILVTHCSQWLITHNAWPSTKEEYHHDPR